MDFPICTSMFCMNLGSNFLEKKIDPKIDGVSIVPLLKGEKIEPRNIYWHIPAYLQSY